MLFPSILEILSHVPSQVENSEPLNLSFIKDFRRALEAIPCGFSLSFKPYHSSLLTTEMLNLCPAFETPRLSPSRGGKGPLKPCSGEQFILTSFRIKSVSTCLTAWYVYQDENKSLQSLPLYLYHFVTSNTQWKNLIGGKPELFLHMFTEVGLFAY